MDELLKIRYRAGLVGESRRVVHAAVLCEDPTSESCCYVTACGAEYSPLDMEEIPHTGMPCMACVTALYQAG